MAHNDPVKSHYRKDIILFWMLTIVLILSYVITAFPFVIRFLSSQTSEFIYYCFIFLAPIVLIGILLFLGRRIFSVRHLLRFFVILYLLLAAPIALSIFGLLNYHGEGGAGAAIMAGSLLVVLIYLGSHLVITITYFVAYRFLGSRNFVTPFVCAVGVYALLFTGAWLYMQQWSHARDQAFCSGEAHALYTQVFFLQPINKEEVLRIARERGFIIRQMLVTEKKSGTNRFRLPIQPGISATTSSDLPIESMVEGRYFNEESNPTSTAMSTLQAYDRNEPVVWFLEFAPAPMREMAGYVYDLDIIQHRLGIYEEDPNVIEGYPFTGVDPIFISPATKKHRIIQSRCYREIEAHEK